MRPPRFDRLFGVADRDGVVINREDVPVNILDWTDVDVSRYSPVGAGGASEETYDKGHDRYEPHNHFFDTVEEMLQVRGVSEDLWAYFGDFFTVYATQDCKVLAPAMEPTAWPLLAAMIAASAADRSAVFEPNTLLVAQQVGEVRAVLDAAEAAARGGAWVLGWLRYEAGYHFPTDVLAGAAIGATAG